MLPKAKVVAKTTFIEKPEKARSDQDKGSDAGRLIEFAARECYDSYGKGRSSEEFHGHIKEVGHGSVLEHAYLSFRIWDISRGCSHELVRHRVGVAISQRSTRYVEESGSEWCWHPLTDHEDFAGIKDEIECYARGAYAQIANRVENDLIARGLDKLTARKQARGAARGALGNALATSMVWTANVRCFRNVIEQRASRFADAEIRLLANALYEQALEYWPEHLSDYRQVRCPDGIGYELATEHRKL